MQQGVEYDRGAKVRGVVVVAERWRGKVGSVELKVGYCLFRYFKKSIEEFLGYVDSWEYQAVDSRFGFDQYCLSKSYDPSSSFLLSFFCWWSLP